MGHRYSALWGVFLNNREAYGSNSFCKGEDMSCLSDLQVIAFAPQLIEIPEIELGRWDTILMAPI